MTIRATSAPTRAPSRRPLALLPLFLCVALVGGRTAATSMHLIETLSPSHIAPSRGVTRISPVPADAPAWPARRGSAPGVTSTLSRSGDAGHGLILVDAMPSDSEKPTATATRPRKLRDRGAPVRRRGAYAEDGGFEIAVQPGRLADSRDDELPYSLWDGAGRRPQYLDHDDLDQPPSLSFEVASAESVEATPASKHHGHGLKGHGADGGDGRGPVVVRAPPFNSVAIGFLIYLVLLTLLQASIYNTSQKGLLSSLLGPLGLKPSRNRRDMEDDLEDADVVLGQAGERRVSILGLEHHDHGLQDGAADAVPALEHRPVLVAAVLDSADEGTSSSLGGPRSGRTRWDAPSRAGWT